MFRNLIAVTFIVVVGNLLHIRFQNLETNPPGFYLDESSISYNALLISKTGLDEHGVSYPVYFKAFGEYKNPLYIYFQAVLFTVIKPSIYSARLVSAIFGLFAVLLFGVFSWSVSKSKVVTGVNIILVLTNPWIFLQSRIVFEVISSVFLCVLAITLLQKYSEKLSKKFFYYFCASLALLFYSYTAFRFLSPIYLIVALVFYRKKLGWKATILSTFLYSASLFPAISWEINNPGSLLFAYQRVQIDLGNYGGELVKNYLNHLNLNFLFGSGDGYLRHTFSQRSLFLVSTSGYIIFGLFEVIREARKKIYYRILMVYLFLSPLPSALTYQSPHSLRSVAYVSILLIICVYGVTNLLRQKNGKVYVASLSILMLFEFTVLYRYFKNSYPEEAQPWFKTSQLEAYKEITHYPEPYFIVDTFGKESHVTLKFIVSSSGRKLGKSSIVEIEKLSETSIEGTYMLDTTTCAQAKIFFSGRYEQHHNSKDICVLSLLPKIIPQ